MRSIDSLEIAGLPGCRSREGIDHAPASRRRWAIAGRDLSLHGWRDWALVILAVPLFLVIIVAAARIGVGSMGEAPFPVPWEIVAAAVVLALGAGLLWKSG